MRRRFALRQEVEALLAQQASAAGVLEGRAVAAAAHMVSETGAPVLSGRDIGTYQVQARIGAGGMGEVYRAFDNKLKRAVAIKFLSNAAADPTRRRRFQREAQTASSRPSSSSTLSVLSPNIVHSLFSSKFR